jgi:hypothetical protein
MSRLIPAPAGKGQKSGRVLYFSTWGAEGSRASRPGTPEISGGIPAGGIVPGLRKYPASPDVSWPETAFPATHDEPDARMALRHPAAQQLS